MRAPDGVEIVAEFLEQAGFDRINSRNGAKCPASGESSDYGLGLTCFEPGSGDSSPRRTRRARSRVGKWQMASGQNDEAEFFSSVSSAFCVVNGVFRVESGNPPLSSVKNATPWGFRFIKSALRSGLNHLPFRVPHRCAWPTWPRPPASRERHSGWNR